MFKRLTYLGLTGCLLLFTAATAVASPQEKKEKQVKDQQEYDLINQAIKETDPAKKLQVLDEWKQKYLETDYAEERLRMYMGSYQQANQGAKALETAKELLKLVPGDFSANYTITLLTPFLGGNDPQLLQNGEAAAKALVSGGIEQQFKPENKQPNVPDAEWANAKKQAQMSAHQTLGWIAMQRKNNVEAEEQFKKALQLSPSSAQISYWLGNVVLAQGDPTKNELALFSFARAAVHEGEGALPPESRQQVADYLTKVYTKYTGTEEGLPELKEMAQQRALPSPDLKIESAEVRAYQAEQTARRENPLLYRFIDLKANLLGSGGDGVWAELRGKMTPEMRLYVVSASPPERPQTINLSSRPGGPVEVILNLENRLRTGVRSGRQITFEGVAASLSKSPFRLTLNDGKML